MILVDIIFPALLSFAIYWFMRKKGWIKDGDMILQNA